MKVDKFGNIIGGVDPFEGTDVKLEDQPKVGDDEKVGATSTAFHVSVAETLTLTHSEPLASRRRAWPRARQIPNVSGMKG